MADLIAGLTDDAAFNKLSATEFKIGGVKFMKIGSELGRIIRGKKGELAAEAVLSKKAIVIAIGKGSPQDVASAVEKMAADLSSQGY